MEKTSKKESIIIVGARMDGHAGVILDTLETLGDYEVLGFVDNTPELQNSKINGVPVIGSTDYLDTLDLPTLNIHIAIGDNVSRYNLFKQLKQRKCRFVTIIHPSATVSKNSVINEGCFIGPNVVITKGVEIGYVSIVNSGAIVEHNCKIGNAVHLAPGVKTAGRVTVDDCSFLGTGSTILPDINIGSGVMIGAGATVTKNVLPDITMVGYAAKRRRKNIYADLKPDVSAAQKIYIAQPTLPEYPLLDEKFRDIAKSLMLSNFAKYSNKLEDDVESSLSVKKALTFPNATSALMLALQALELKGEVILPSFTFSATGHAVVWNGLTPVFADIEPETYNIDTEDVERKITKNTSAILGVHVFGNPANIDSLEKIAKKHNLVLLFDSSHALGSKYKEKAIGGFGELEVFSLSGTKLITAAEGGVVTSNNEELMNKMDIGRNYGAGDDYNCQYIGLNGKMSEFHAAIAIESLSMMEKFVRQRNELANLYKKRLSEIPGISFQHIPEENISSFKDFSILIDTEVFGMSRNELVIKLNSEGIFPKKYFFPIHLMKAYEKVKFKADKLTNTEFVANNIVCLPIYNHMNNDTLEKICYAIFRIWHNLNKK